ncbi:MAG: glycogen/starch synthase [Muribaculaceae bacterium]|nr:glycogen/starch synthase [Muribaculaceae bacterium]
MDKPKVLFISQEITPYLPATAMSTLSVKLPQSMQERGFEVRTFMPKYGCINERRNQLHEVIRLSGMNLIIDDTDHPLIIKVATLQPARMQVYFIDNDDYFRRSGASDIEIRQLPEDNDERSIFFVRGVVETVKKLRWEAAVVHCSGWISALAPIYIKKNYGDDPSFSASKVVYSLQDDRFDGTLDARFVEKLMMDNLLAEDLKALTESGDGVDYEALTRLAIDHADAIVQASDNVSDSILQYAKASGKPMLHHTGDEDYADAYAEFYRSLLQ